jgi:MIP family channel proteins
MTEMNISYTRNDQRAIAAEFLGTMFFVFIGCGSVVAMNQFAVSTGLDVVTSGGVVAIALAFGLGILIAAAWTGNLSGGHINPAVTLAMLLARKIEPAKAAAYVVAQFAGATVGALVLMWASPNAVEGNLGANRLAVDVASGEGLLLEIVLTAFLVLVIFGTAVSTKGWGVNAPIAIGFTVAVVHLVGVPFTGTSVNPARSFGPALVANEWDDFWIFLIGPAIGAVVIAVGWMFWKTLGDDLDPEETPA